MGLLIWRIISFKVNLIIALLVFHMNDKKGTLNVNILELQHMWRVQSLSNGYSHPSPLFHTSSASSYNNKNDNDQQESFYTVAYFYMIMGQNHRSKIFIPEEVMLHLPLVQRVRYFRLHERWVQIKQGNEGMQINSSLVDYKKVKVSCLLPICK